MDLVLDTETWAKAWIYATIQTEMQKSGADLYLRDELNSWIDVKGGHMNTRISKHACTFEVLIIKRFLSNVEKMGYTRISISMV